MNWHDIKDWSCREFFDLAEQYAIRCANRFAAAHLLVAKWRPEDLIPGLSDLDSRVICDDMNPERWLAFEEEASAVQLEFMREDPEWNRKLEHTPGTCISSKELLDEALYESEMHTWNYYWGDSELYLRFQDYLASKPWDQRDEYYQLKRWLTFWGRYNKDLDPLVNVPAALVFRYGLHSRCLHYFVPALHAALGLLKRRPMHGKRETLYHCMEIYPRERVLLEVADLVDRQYKTSQYDDPASLQAFDDRLFAFLQVLAPQVLEAVTIVDLEGQRTMENLRAKLKDYSRHPLQAIFHALRVFRIRRGRYYCYLNAPEGFELDLMIPREVALLGNATVETPWKTYGRLLWGEDNLSVPQVWQRLNPGFLSPEELRVAMEIRLGFSTRMDYRAAKDFMIWAQDHFATYYRLLERMFADARHIVEAAS